MKYCSLPFKGLYVYPNGDVRVCGWTYACIGNLLEESFESIWNGEKAEQIRDAIRDGSFSLCNKTACQYLQNDSLPDLSQEEFAKEAVVSDLPKVIDAAYDYICNHSCPSCRHEIFKTDKKYIDQVNKISEILLPILNQSENFMINGNGDLFASPYIMNMMNRLDIQNEDCEIMLQTNGVLFTEKNWKLIEHLSKYNIKVVVTPNSYDRLSYKYLSGGHDNLDKLIENLHFIKGLRESGKVKRFDISIVVQDRNYRELPSFVERSLEEFHADSVIIKPLYYWFALTHEEYWFKDILNPLHPYHNEYMEILKDPILDDPRVYFWGAHNLHEKKVHPATDFKVYLDTLSSIFKCKDPKVAIESALINKGYRKVAIYGVNDMAEVLFNLLADTEIEVVGFIDRYGKVDSFCGLEVVKFDKFNPQAYETILVSNFIFMENIKRDLDFYGFKGNVIPMDQILV